MIAPRKTPKSKAEPPRRKPWALRVTAIVERGSEATRRIKVHLRPWSLAAYRWAKRHRGALSVVLAGLLYFAYAAFITWPMVTDPAHIFYGAPGDATGTITSYRDFVTDGLTPFQSGTISQLGAPEGLPIPWAVDLAAAGGVGTQYVLALIGTLFTGHAASGATAGNGLYILLGYVITGLITFLFVRRLTGNLWASLLGGWVFAFFPFAVLNGQGHFDYIYGGVLLLGIWRMIELLWRPTIRNGVLAGVAVVVGMAWTPYFILFGGLAYAACAVSSLAMNWRPASFRAAVVPQAVAASIVVTFMGVLLWLSGQAPGQGIGVPANSELELTTYAARPAEYIVPDRLSSLFGSLTSGYLTSHIHGSNFTEATLYIGDSIVILVLIALVMLVRRRLHPRSAQAVVVLAVVAGVALIVSAPPQVQVAHTLINFPSYYIRQVTAAWRVYSRLVIVVMGACTCVAAVGMTVIVRNRKLWLRALLMVVITGIVVVDLYSRLYPGTNGTGVPPDILVLAHEPPGLVAEYPLIPHGYGNYSDIYFEGWDGHPYVNGYDGGSVEETRALDLANLADPATAGDLAALGVRYVVLELEPVQVVGPSVPTTLGKGYRQIAHDVFDRLYAVTAAPTGPGIATAATGFLPTENDGTGPFNWLGGSSGTIEIAGRSSRLDGVLRMSLYSLASRPRLVTITSAAGKVLARRRVVGPTTIAVPVRANGRFTSVTLRTSPGAEAISKALGVADPRSVSINLSAVSFDFASPSARARP